MYYILLGLLLLFFNQSFAADELPPPTSVDGSTLPPPKDGSTLPPPKDGSTLPPPPKDGSTLPPPKDNTLSDSENTGKPPLQTTIDVDGAQISLVAGEKQCTLTIESGNAGLSSGVEETDTCGAEQSYSSSLDFERKKAAKEGFFCIKTPNNNYGWGKHNCEEINQFQYADNGESIEIPVHEPPQLIVSENITDGELLHKTVAYGDKFFIVARAESAQGYKLDYSLRHAPIDTKVDSYNSIITWEANLLGKFRFDIIIRERDAKYPQELILKASVNVLEYKLTDYGLDPDNIQAVTAEQIENLPAEAFKAFREPNIKLLHPDIFNRLSPEQLHNFTYAAMSAISVNQFLNIPPEILKAASITSFGGFSPDVLAQFTTTHVKALDPNVIFAKLPGEDISKMVTNFDLRKISPKDINDLLPPAWFLDAESGLLIVPGGVPLTVKVLEDNPAPPPRVNKPKLPKLNSGVALGGGSEEDTPSILSGMNTALAQNNLGQFTFAQDADGIVKATDGSGLQFAFIPNSTSFSQEDDDAEVGVQLGKRELRVVTSDQQKLSLIPAPKDMTALQNILPNGDIYMGNKGDIIFSYSNVVDNRNQRDDETDVVVVSEFDAYVESEPEDDCDDYELYACDDYSETLGVQLTRRTVRMTRAGQYQSPKGRVVYADKTAQTIYPTIIEPAIFLTMLHQIDGLDDAEVYQNGAYLISFQNKPYILQPDFTATATPLPKPGQLVPPAIHFREGGYLEYEVASNDIEYVQKVYIYPYVE